MSRRTILHAGSFGFIEVKTLATLAAIVLAFGFASTPITIAPPTVPIPASLFGMHVHYVVVPNSAGLVTP